MTTPPSRWRFLLMGTTGGDHVPAQLRTAQEGPRAPYAQPLLVGDQEEAVRHLHGGLHLGRLHGAAHLCQHVDDGQDRRPRAGRARLGGPGLRGVRPVHPRAARDQRRGAGVLQAAGLERDGARAQRKLPSGAPVLRHALQPEHDLPHQPFRGSAREPDQPLHERLHGARRRGGLLAHPHHREHLLHHHHSGARGPALRGHPLRPAHALRGGGLHHVREDPAPLRRDRCCAEPPLGRALRCRDQHPRRQDLRARGLRARPVRCRRQGRDGRREALDERHDGARRHDLDAHHHHHARDQHLRDGRQCLVRHQRGNARDDVLLHLPALHALQLHQLDDAAHEPRGGRRLRDDAHPGRAAPGGGCAGSPAARRARWRHRFRGARLPLPRRRRGRLRVRGARPARSRRPAPRPRGALGIGQDHAHQAAPAPRRRAGGPCARGRPGHLPVHPAVPAPADRLRAAGGAAVPPLHPREHRVRAPRRDRRRDSRGGASGQRAGVRRPAAQRHGHHGRRARRQALGRPAPARGDRPRDTGGLPDPRAR